MYIFDEDNLALSAAIVAALQIIGFILICCLQLEQVAHVTGGLSFIAVAMFTLFMTKTYQIRQLLVTSLVSIWAVRLSAYLLYRMMRSPSLKQFEDTDNTGCKLFGFWIFQAVWVFLTSLPIIFTNSPQNVNNPFAETFTMIDGLGILMFWAGFMCETVADIQKFLWRDDNSHLGKFCKIGLWSWSRHPNYFGELLVWWGMFLMCSCMLWSYQWVALISPMFTTVILLFLSGVPMRELDADLQYGQMHEYREYKRKTSVIVPVAPPVYKLLPAWFRHLFCCDFPLYNTLEPIIDTEQITSANSPSSSSSRSRLGEPRPVGV